MTIMARTTLNIYDNLIAKFRGYFYTDSIFRKIPQEMTSYLISFYFYFYLPTDPTLAHQMSIDLIWHGLRQESRTYLGYIATVGC